MTKHYIKYGALITIFLVIYFLLLRAVELHTITILSAFNAVIYGIGIFFAIKSYKNTSTNFKYEEGFQAGLLSGAFASVLFGIVMAIYMYHIDPTFSASILEGWNLNLGDGTFLLVISVMIMGLATSFVLTLAFMQLLKDSWNTHQNKSS